MKTLIALILTFLTTVAYASNFWYVRPGTQGTKIGVNKVNAEVIFTSDKYNFHNCRNRKHGDNRGFFIAQRKDNGSLVLYCGTSKKRGDEVHVTIEEGI